MGLRRRGLRLLASLLLGLWAGLAVVILVAYRPGGPWDLLVACAAFIPVPIAALAVIWPPLVRPWRPAAVIAWLGLAAALIVGPLLLLEVRGLAAGGRQSLLPSAEVTYAWLLGLSATCLFAGLGVAASRRSRDITSLDGLVYALGLAGLFIVGSAFVFGGAALANELALRDLDVGPSSFGPTDPDLAPPACDAAVALGPSAELDVAAKASVDNVVIGHARLAGVRQGLDESWSGIMTSQYAAGTAGYARIGDEAWLQVGHDGWQDVSPDPFGMRGPDQLTLDGPMVATIMANPRPVAEDLGTELFDGARARHCRTAIDGPTALAASLPLRWLAGGGLLKPAHRLAEWRGYLDWWVFTDGQLGQATILINGYPGDAWPRSGLQGSLEARLTALDRTANWEIRAPVAQAGGSAAPTPTPSGSAVGSPSTPSPSAVEPPAVGPPAASSPSVP